MDKVTVFNYKKFDIIQGKYINPGTFATKAFITSIGAEALEENKKDVPLSSLNSDGQHIE
jgi:hypothetical protein